MRKNSHLTIKLIDEIASIIGSRDVVANLKELVVKANSSSVIFDFAGIEFISRSAAHEFLLLKDELKKHNVDLQFAHVDKSVARMLELVEKNRLAPKSNDVPQFERVALETLFAQGSAL